jgi:hypothetical protein
VASDYRVLRIDLESYLTGYISGPKDVPWNEDALTAELQALAKEGWELVSTELLPHAPHDLKEQLLLFLAKH